MSKSMSGFDLEFATGGVKYRMILKKKFKNKNIYIFKQTFWKRLGNDDDT